MLNEPWSFCEICSTWNQPTIVGMHECELFVWAFCVVTAFSLNIEDPMNLGHWIYRGGGGAWPLLVPPLTAPLTVALGKGNKFKRE